MDKPFAITLDPGSSLANKTGTWRTEQPVYVDLMPPCNHACPAGENIQQWLYRAEEGGAGYEAAWRQIMQDNPLPAIMGRVCYRPCETACNRGQLDSAVGINSVEGFLGDEAIRQGWTVPVTAPDSGKRVLVVGAGPSGLSAAYHLRLLGHQVTLRDTAPWAGGMMRFGIPAYRLPRDVLEAEVGRILAMGVSWEGGQTVTDIEAAMADGGFDAAFLAVGAQRGKRAEIPAGDSAKILDAVTLLHAMDGAQPPLLGRRVAVYGGGNTAMDAARTARRLGATDAVVVYRRTRDRMPGPRDRGGGSRRGRRADDVAVHHCPCRRRLSHDREDEAGRDGVPAAHGRVHHARRRHGRARSRAGGRAVPARRGARHQRR